ncbi:MAG: Ig-like domain-containing protein [Ferruginibacter sp.]
MKLSEFLKVVALCSVITSLLVSCRKDESFNKTTPEIASNARVSGAAADDPAVLSKISSIISADFLKQGKFLSGNNNIYAKGKPDNILPSVNIDAPSNNATVTGTISVQATASDNVGVSLVSLSIDGLLVASKSTAPYDFPWNSATVTNGTHTITVVAKDAAGNSKSVSIQVSVSNVSGGDITSPTVVITSPVNGSSVSGTVNIQSDANDNIGVSSVTYAIDGVTAGSSSTAPYTYSWNSSTVANGMHTITATAKDAAGNVGTNSIQAMVNTVVIPPTTLPSSYQLTMPPVRNQGTEGSCVAFAAVYAARSAEQYYQTNATSYSEAVNLFSPEYVFNQVNLGGDCTSSSVVPTLDLMKSQGVCTWQTMPYSTYNGCSIMPGTTQSNEAASYKILSYSTIIAQDQVAIKTMIVNKHPVIATINIDQQFYDATPGFIWSSYTNNSGYHAIALCGYDDSKHAYKAVNSWGTNWGDAGYIWIDYDFFPTVSSYYTFSLSL